MWLHHTPLLQRREHHGYHHRASEWFISHYKEDYEANKNKNTFNAYVTEKYEKDKALSANIRSDKGYHAAHEKSKVNYTLIDKTSEMERASIQRDLRDANYSREAKKLAMKYGLTHDDIKLKTMMHTTNRNTVIISIVCK